jgi:hypothetical protein
MNWGKLLLPIGNIRMIIGESEEQLNTDVDIVLVM